jgi:3-hydroxyisobutyrate dehydrogenase-like beta-hydroxyacid dehydrogenase
METEKLKVGFLGFGEAGYHFAKDLTQAGLSGIVAYSPSGAKAAPGDPICVRATEAGVELVSSPRELCKRAHLIIALVPGQAALRTLRSVRAYLGAAHIYVDASTAAVKAMEQAGQMLAGKSGFVDAAIMGTVPLSGIKVLTVASGPHAEVFRALMAPYGMNIQVIGEKPGAATAMKLIRSVCMKGLAALLLESLEAAQRYGILDAVAVDVAGSIDERPFAQIIKRFVCGTAVHAERRVHEMTESIELLRSLGASTRMTRATRAMLLDVVKLGLPARFGGREPDSIEPVLDAIVGAKG